jgi:GWxTD domain-containing protein
VLLFSAFPSVAQQTREQQRSREAEESGSALKRWLDEDVAYIITSEERSAFRALTTDEEREQFIESFWLRRDPTPDTLENEFRDDHFARIAYANERFASGLPGWKTDRGRIYIIHGEPTEIESKPSGGTYHRPFDEGGGVTSVFPFEKWRYRYIEGMGNEIFFEFVDPTMSGEYRLAIDPSEKDALMHVPGAGLTENEELYGIDKAERWNADYARLGPGMGAASRMSQFDRLQNYVNAFRPPEVKFKDLEAIADVTTRLSFNVLPFNFRADFVKVTEESILTPITIQFAYKDLAFQQEGEGQDSVHTSTIHVYARITGVNGRLVGQFEDTIVAQEPATLFQAALDRNKSAIYQKVQPLRPGLYKLELVVKDMQSQNVGVVEQRLAVPRFAEAQLAASSLILADLIEPLPARQVASGSFILGSTKVRPSVKDEFTQTQNLNYWVQVYGLKLDEGTKKPSATIETLITRNGREVKKLVEEASELSGAAQQMTVTKSLPLADLEPGEYSIQVKITDNLANALIAKTGRFAVR